MFNYRVGPLIVQYLQYQRVWPLCPLHARDVIKLLISVNYFVLVDFPVTTAVEQRSYCVQKVRK